VLERVAPEQEPIYADALKVMTECSMLYLGMIILKYMDSEWEAESQSQMLKSKAIHVSKKVTCMQRACLNDTGLIAKGTGETGLGFFSFYGSKHIVKPRSSHLRILNNTNLKTLSSIRWLR
jgi:hypothetical protein